MYMHQLQLHAYILVLDTTEPPPGRNLPYKLELENVPS